MAGKTLDAHLPPMVGKVFGRSTVVAYLGPNRHGKRQWELICSCGKHHTAATGDLNSGSVISCGCYSRAALGRLTFRHGNAASTGCTKTYSTWARMLSRCNNKNNKDFLHYGGRGISVCDRWRMFENFLVDMGEVPEGMSIDRIDVNGNYELGNCRWASIADQARNKRTSRTVTVRGETGNLAAMCEKYKVNYDTVRARLNRGMSDEAAFFTEVKNG